MEHVELGCGLTSLGRRWGFHNSEVPSEVEAISFLEYAVEQGIRFFDTAPSYGYSEERLGKFLTTLSPSQLRSLVLATKCGEGYDFATHMPFINHTPDYLRKSIERSFRLLPKIDLLQLHRTQAETLRDERVLRVLEDYHQREQLSLGVSLHDLETALLALQYDIFDAIQFSFNRERNYLKPLFALARTHNKTLIINRPVNEGKLLETEKHQDSFVEDIIKDAFHYILQHPFHGVVLTGTKNKEHLRQNISLFNSVRKDFG